MSENTVSVAVGSTIWRFDENVRVYEKNGRGGPIWREHWRPAKIVGETSRSWVTNYYDGKVPKKGSHRGWAFSQTEIDDAEYVAGAWRIADSVRLVRHAATLREIERLVREASK